MLTGSRGTGKSSIVRALLTAYSAQGLRLIEIERDDLSDLPKIQKLIAERPEKFIVYCDDLAFNAEDENYRSLKSVLDGSLQSGSTNFIIYATSNRRHLLPEFMHENTPLRKVDVPQYTELHPQEAIEEKSHFLIVLDYGFPSIQWISSSIWKSWSITSARLIWNITIQYGPRH